MKHYPKTYEDVFSVDRHNSSTRLKLDRAGAGDIELDKYVLLFRNFLSDFYSNLFDNCVKLSWLRRKFTYHGHKTRMPINRNSIGHNNAFVKLLRRNIGKDIQIITRAKFFAKLETYFDEMFPGFDEGNPFENPDYYKFPFKNISVEFLIVVHQMEERMDMLKYADSRAMSYAKFLDYVINHVCSANDELGYTRYEIRNNTERNFSFYIKDTEKKLPTKHKKS